MCADCKLRDIIGPCYKCGHCVNYTLCAMCFPYKNHPIEHLFLVLEQPYLGPLTEPLLRDTTIFAHSVFSGATNNNEMCMDVVQPPSSSSFTFFSSHK